MEDALEIARFIAVDALHAAGLAPSPRFSLIFKTLDFESTIIQRFSKAATLPATVGKPFEIKCANNPMDIDPVLWMQCQGKPAGVVLPGGSTANPGIILCPNFFKLPDETFGPDPAMCPRVEGNVFAPAPRSAVTKAFVLFSNILRAYNPDLALVDASVNALLRFDPVEAAANPSSFKLFAVCKSRSAQSCGCSYGR